MPTFIRVETICPDTVLEWPRFFQGRMLTDDDLTLEQTYLRDKLRRHNQSLHGWGVVSGAALDYTKDPWMIVVKRGVALAPDGNEIVVPGDVAFDLRTRYEITTPFADKSQSATSLKCESGATTAIVAIEYFPIQTQPITDALRGDELHKEASRWLDSYRICVLDELPPSHIGEPRTEPVLQGPPPDCSRLPADSRVVLGEVSIQSDGKVDSISYAHRRQVVSFAQCWWRPTDPSTNSNP